MINTSPQTSSDESSPPSYSTGSSSAPSYTSLNSSDSLYPEQGLDHEITSVEERRLIDQLNNLIRENPDLEASTIVRASNNDRFPPNTNISSTSGLLEHDLDNQLPRYASRGFNRPQPDILRDRLISHQMRRRREQNDSNEQENERRRNDDYLPNQPPIVTNPILNEEFLDFIYTRPEVNEEDPESVESFNEWMTAVLRWYRRTNPNASSSTNNRRSHRDHNYYSRYGF